MFNGLCAFLLTPFDDAGFDDAEYARLVGRVARSGVDSLTALGSTGNYAYLTSAERARAASVAVEAADGLPVLVGVGALGTREVLEHVEDAQAAGAAGVLLAPMSYWPLTDDEVFGLFEEVDAHLSVPMVVYDNPTTTGVTFSAELYARVAALGSVASIKINAPSLELGAIRARLAEIRRAVPATVTIGLSDDPAGANGLLAGCTPWYSVLSGTLPEPCLAIARAAMAGDAETAQRLSADMQPLWALFARHGSLRVTSAVAELAGVTTRRTLLRPLRGLDARGRADVRSALDTIGIVHGHPRG